MELPNFGKTLKDLVKLPIFEGREIKSCSKYLSEEEQRELFNMYVLSFMTTPTLPYMRVLEILGVKDKVIKYTIDNKDWKDKVRGSYHFFLRKSNMIRNKECREIVQTALIHTQPRLDK